MRHLVVSKQPNSKMCFVCGLRNSLGLRASFYELDNGDLVATFTPETEHQGYPGRLHGGIASAVLDETIGRAILLRQDNDVWGVTAGLNLRFRKPVPLGEPLRVVGRITKETQRHFEGRGELLLADGTKAVEASGKYLKFQLDSIADFDEDEQEWRVTSSDDDPDALEIPEW